MDIELYGNTRHPPNFLSAEFGESETLNGVHLPAFPGKTLQRIPNLTAEARVFMLSCFRRDMLSNRQNRSGISTTRHLDVPVRVTGILFLSDNLMQAVNVRKLSNTLLERFHPSQGIEDIVAIIDRCSYEELNIRHCVLAWGHDLMVYLQNDPIVAAGRSLNEYFQLLDWAVEVELHKQKAKIHQSLFTKAAVESRFCQLFELCRRKLDLTYFRYMEERMRERQISWQRHDYDGA
ncbi:hypothetical protein DICVIV_04858 [Dictyocaulus viviparus]|uniref:Uncharacterized protein n=1 Tax=Dictyocaulus viviparus TaxID=29172 RepID=A0A0D8XWY1_DICVI|nr:hypothetical protein DICVIV_04858 [Dictyocaulus viviparus]